MSDQQEKAVIPIPDGVTLPIVAGEDFSTLAKELTAQTEGRDLADKAGLEGMPFIMTSFTFRPGTNKPGAKKGEIIFGDYVSVEAVTYTNQRIVFNDGSTGIRRQVVNWLIAQGIIPALDDPDTAFQYWDSENVLGTWGGAADKPTLKIEATRTGEPIRFLARHGLRSSEYTNEYGDSVTWYLG